MPDAYEIVFRPEVEDDLRPIGRYHQRRVLAAVEERLVLDPERYGKPLGGALAGLRRLRVGDYRVAYQVKGRRVLIWAVLHRRVVYAEVVKRFFAR